MCIRSGVDIDVDGNALVAGRVLEPASEAVAVWLADNIGAVDYCWCFFPLDPYFSISSQSQICNFPKANACVAADFDVATGAAIGNWLNFRSYIQGF